MKILLLSLAIFLFAGFSYGQTQSKKNTIFLEAGGNGLFGSLNYERQFTNEPGFGFRAGIGFYSEHLFNLTVPVGINYLFKLKDEKSFLVAGIGVTFHEKTWVFLTNPPSYGKSFIVSFIPSFGYRRHTDKNLMWRFNFTPVINKEGFVPWAGLSLGKRF